MRVLVLALVLACSSSRGEPMPFQIPTWNTPPSDDELVAAIVGSGGTADERADLERITRDLVLPRLADRDPARLRWSLERMQRAYQTTRDAAIREAFLRFALLDTLGELRARAAKLAAATLQARLWPAEPLPEPWEASAGIDPASVGPAAHAVEARITELTARYGGRVPQLFADAAPALDTVAFGEHRTVALLRDHLHVALTGDTAVTAGEIYTVLAARGVATNRDPVDRPY